MRRSNVSWAMEQPHAVITASRTFAGWRKGVPRMFYDYADSGSVGPK